jgi:hypothetical protein
MSDGHQQPQPDALPCQADLRLILKTGNYFRPVSNQMFPISLNPVTGHRFISGFCFREPKVPIHPHSIRIFSRYFEHGLA